MGMRELETQILAEAKTVTGNPKLKQRDILEWSSGPITPQPGERIFRLPQIGVNIAVRESPALPVPKDVV